MPTAFVSELEQVAKAYRLRLKELDSQVLSDLAREYGNVYRVARREVTQLVTKVMAEVAQGVPVPVGQIYREQRLEELMRKVGVSLEQFVADAQGRLEVAQDTAISDAITFAQTATQASLSTAQGLTLGAHWAQIGDQAILNIVSNTAPGGPVYRVFQSLAPQAASEVRDTIVNGIAQGYNPRKVAQEVHQTLGTSLARSQTIARTEMMRAQREASIQSYRANSDVVSGWVWSAADDENTCEECWALDGTFFDIEVDADAHINCRCCVLPETKGYNDLGFGEMAEVELPEELDPEGIAPELSRAGANIDAADGTVTAYYTTTERVRNTIERSGVIEKAIPLTIKPVGTITMRLQVPVSQITKTGSRLSISAGDVSQYLTSGPAKFAQLTPAQQLRILGPSKYRAYKDGAVNLRDFIGHRDSTVWGRSSYSRSLREVLGTRRARQYYGVRAA